MNKKLLIVLFILILIFSSMTDARKAKRSKKDTFCDVNEIKQSFRKIFYLYLTEPDSVSLILDEIKDLLSFYLSIGEGVTTVKCSNVDGSLSNTSILDIIDISKDLPDKIPICSDGTKYGECSTFKPKYCYAGSLLYKCDYCGCPGNESCSSTGACI